ncbi:alpha/beta hydrolase-fold protein [Nibrella viscosa]|uniref:Alpha/beta hydrolase-fold protein n=1 Tax=Nibrella viscosa TaxID=1084524 RepID=A0ABP8KLQ2_9BACT
MRLLPVLSILCLAQTVWAQPQFSVSFPASRSDQPLDGRLLLILANNDKAEPRFQINDDAQTQMVFGVNVDALKPGQPVVVDSRAFGYPRRSLADVPPGDYYVQALLHRYETFRRKDGHVVKLPMDRGEGQNWRTAPGNLLSKPVKIRIDPKQKQFIRLVMDQENPPIPAPADTRYIKHIKIQSKLLSEFWGRPMFLGAHVLLPAGFDEHPDARYPLCVFHGHFPGDFSGFSETPPDPKMDTTDYIERFNLYGYRKIVAQEAYNFYRQWTSKDFPRMLIVEIQHPTPYYDDSYAVNSANQGPYGDAITYELIPEIERRFRGIGQGWARFLYGGSTGGWEALAAQVFYPDEYNGCFAACPDPITFSAYTVVDIYKDKNAYYLDSPFKRTPRPGKRDYLGHVKCTVEDMNHRELALGTNGRSGDQWDIWQAVYSPVGPDGYPKPIWNKLTGEIDPTVAAYWRENYDLLHILKRDWAKLGPKLTGKIHIYCGDMDNYYLNNAVYLMEDFLKQTKSPHYYGEVDYGDRAEHCWNGDHTQPNYISRLRYNTLYLPKILKRLETSAPAGADLRSWRY